MPHPSSAGEILLPMVRFRACALIATLGTALASAGCGTLGPTVGQVIPQIAGGESANVPAAPTSVSPFPAVSDIPPARDQKLFTQSEQAKVEAELTHARSEVAAQGVVIQKQHDAEEAARKDLEAKAAAARARAAAQQKERAASMARRDRLKLRADRVREESEALKKEHDAAVARRDDPNAPVPEMRSQGSQ